jgi:hypothetical protein
MMSAEFVITFGAFSIVALVVVSAAAYHRLLPRAVALLRRRRHAGVAAATSGATMGRGNSHGRPASYERLQSTRSG